MKHKTTRIILALSALWLPSLAQAQLYITEAESSEATAGTFANPQDWFELSNFGSSSENITGYTMDDNSDSFALSVALHGITTIAAGESVVFFETTGTTLTPADFQNWWGLSPSVQIGTYAGSGVGLSSSSDQINIFNSSGTEIDGVSFGTATKGDTFVFNSGAMGRAPIGLSQTGVDGAFTSANSDIGSPGVAAVPEPASLVLLATGVAASFGFRRVHYRRA